MTESATASEHPSAPSMLRVRAAMKSDTGLVRTENQDFALMTLPEEETPESGALYLVADGMGGHRGGATASRLAATTIRDEYLASAEADLPHRLRDSFISANSKIFHEAAGNSELRGMGTTCSALVIREGIAHVAHVGDSRIYLVRGGEIRQITEDHSLVASMVREGLLTSKEAEVHPRRNVLQRSMGVAEDVEVDLLQPFPLEPGDTFIICSDGLHGLVKSNELSDVVASLPVERAVQEFVRRALERGAPDNVSVIVAQVEDPSKQVVDPGEIDTDEIPTRTLIERRKGSSGTWLLVVLALAAAAAGVMYWLGYRLDPSLLERFGSR